MTKGVAAIVFGAACLGCTRAHRAGTDPLPAVLQQQPAIPYPPDLFSRRVEGEVVLYLVVDSAGSVVRDSTRVATSSGQTEFDAAALEAAATLRFTPAHRGTLPVTAPILIPIQFRMPDSLSSTRAHP